MNIYDLNTILEKLSKQPSRDTVIEFAFALVEWMGLTPNKDKTPQLVAPKTQKLMEYLLQTPHSVQPQLYRLTADGQNIRIRFAVLKKLKKDYINQLVDNDPGPTSFQSAFREIKNIPGREPYIPKEPYFIHFVTTPDYDRIILIFNQGDQKRLLTFRNRLTQTQYHRIVQQWQGIAQKTKPEITDLFWKSLDVKEVNKDFYRLIKERFDALVGILKNESINADDNQIKQFSVRLIGRYLFCWFLKEKGIVPPELIQSQMIRQTEDYYHQILLKLFFDTLNTRIPERNGNTQNKLFDKIPYLNGGLFDESEDDKLFRNLSLDHWLLSFVEVLENFDFTVDESSSTYQQVAVDPEMLGRIFENLLASQNPETEKFANERKSFGAFYTPREIVDYMVNESLKTYLAGKLNVQPDELETAFSSKQVWPEKLNKRKQEADEALKKIKILDPACGSGAFPMGVLHKLITLRELVGLYPNTYALKKEILSNNIYGVDIMPMAVEIARLRAWLSLIVEEDYKGDKKSGNFGIDALPNLDFKFMQGNSLLETYEGIKLIDESLLTSKTINKKQIKIDKTKQKIKEIERKVIDLNNKNKFKGIEKAILDKELKEYNDLLSKIIKVEEPNISYKLFDPDASAANIADKLKSLHNEFFNTSDKEIKKDLRTEIENLEWELIVTSLTENGKSDQIAELEKLRNKNIKPYFLFELNFPDVFTENNGFDVVIGNPPYGQIQQLSNDVKELERQRFKTFVRTADIYCLFYEQGLSLLRDKGILTFITSNKWMTANYGKNIRRFFAEETNPLVLIDFGKVKIFEEATVFVNILIVQNSPNDNKTKGLLVPEDFFKNNEDVEVYFKANAIALKDLTDNTWQIVNELRGNILDRMKNIGKPLSVYEQTKTWNIEFFRGITSGLNEAFHIDEETKNRLINEDKKSEEIIKPLLRGKDIKRYSYHFENWYIINSHNGVKEIGLNRIDVPKNYPAIYKHLLKYKEQLVTRQDKGDHWTNLRNCTFLMDFEKPKIVWLEISDRANYAYDESGMFLTNSAYFMTGDNLKYILAVLNSTISDYFFFQETAKIAGGRKRYTKQYVEKVPIPELSPSEQEPFVKIVDYILHIRNQKDQSDALKISSYFEQIINGMVYELYFNDLIELSGREIIKHVKQLPAFSPEDSIEKKTTLIRDIYRNIYDKGHPIRNSLFFMDSIDEIREIERTVKEE